MAFSFELLANCLPSLSYTDPTNIDKGRIHKKMNTKI